MEFPIAFTLPSARQPKIISDSVIAQQTSNTTINLSVTIPEDGQVMQSSAFWTMVGGNLDVGSGTINIRIFRETELMESAQVPFFVPGEAIQQQGLLFYSQLNMLAGAQVKAGELIRMELIISGITGIGTFVRFDAGINLSVYSVGQSFRA